MTPERLSAKALEPGEYLRVPAVALGDPEEGGVLEPLEQLQAHDLRVEPLHGVEVVDPQGEFTAVPPCGSPSSPSRAAGCSRSGILL
jgi:hypothetical protein